MKPGEEPGFFSPPALADCHVAIVGLGLMGGSLALALRDHVQSMVGIDPNPRAVALALEQRMVDRAATQPGGLLPQANLVVLAAPVRQIVGLLAGLPELHPGQAVVLDLGSTKREIVRAMAALPPRFDPLGGHPMCGRERGTLAAAERNLFQGHPFALTPLKRTSQAARRLAQNLAEAIGARPLWLDEITHDRWTAATSHLPYLVSNALAGITPLEAAPLIGSGFISATRLAVSPAEMMLDVALTNRTNLLQALHSLRLRLDQMERCLEDDDEAALLSLLKAGAERREALLPPAP